MADTVGDRTARTNDMTALDSDIIYRGQNTSMPLTRVEETVDAIRADIISGELEPGSKLAVEHIRKRYGVGSSTIREALSLLLPDGLVTARGQRGFAVSSISIADLQDLSNTRILLETSALRESIAAGRDDWETGIIASFHHLSKAQEALGRGDDRVGSRMGDPQSPVPRGHHRRVRVALGAPDARHPAPSHRALPPPRAH
jgi:DNA-binding transcriptional regulator YhcF (GntR family)